MKSDEKMAHNRRQRHEDGGRPKMEARHENGVRSYIDGGVTRNGATKCCHAPYTRHLHSIYVRSHDYPDPLKRKIVRLLMSDWCCSLKPEENTIYIYIYIGFLFISEHNIYLWFLLEVRPGLVERSHRLLYSETMNHNALSRCQTCSYFHRKQLSV